MVRIEDVTNSPEDSAGAEGASGTSGTDGSPRRRVTFSNDVSVQEAAEEDGEPNPLDEVYYSLNKKYLKLLGI